MEFLVVRAANPLETFSEPSSLSQHPVTDSRRSTVKAMKDFSYCPSIVSKEGLHFPGSSRAGGQTTTLSRYPYNRTLGEFCKQGKAMQD